MSKRMYLTAEEIKAMLDVTRGDINCERNYCIILLAYRHGMRISELLSLRYNDIDLSAGRLYVRRLKNGFSTIHPLNSDERKALNEWTVVRRSLKYSDSSDLIFISLKGKALSRQQAYRIIREAGKKACISVEAHPHMLRHSCGYELADRGIDTRLIQDYLGHRNIRHTVRYTASNAARFSRIWGKDDSLNAE